MTLKVTISHSQPGYKAKIRVVEYNPALTSEESVPGQEGTVIAAGEAKEFYLHGNQALRVTEVEGE